MEKFTITDFSGGLVESNNPSDYNKNNTQYSSGLIPFTRAYYQSQGASQSIGPDHNAWYENGTSGTLNTSQIISVYPLVGTNNNYLVAIKSDGTIWWVQAPKSDDTYTVANGKRWKRITTADNYGYDAYDKTNQPRIDIVSNPKNRFICNVPLETVKYAKVPAFDITEGDYIYNAIEYRILSNVAYIKYDGLIDVDDLLVGDKFFINDIDGTYDDGTISGVNGVHTVVSLTTDETDDGYGNPVYTSEIGYAKTHSDLPTITLDNGINFPDTYILSLRANIIDKDLSQFTTTSTCSGVLISSRRSESSNSYPSGTTLNTHQSLIAYVDNTSQTVKIVTFPNIRRWPQYILAPENVIHRATGTFVTYASITSPSLKKAFPKGYTPITLTTQDYHSFKKGQKVTLKGVSSTINKTYNIYATNSTDFPTQFTVYYSGKLNAFDTTCHGKASVTSGDYDTYKPVIPFASTSNKHQGEELPFLNIYPIQSETTYTVTHKTKSFSTFSFTLTSVSGLKVGTNITVSGYGGGFDGKFSIQDITGNVVSYSNDVYSFDNDVDTSASGTIKTTASTGLPLGYNFGHPYTYINNEFQLGGGTGFIPRGNVGTMWGRHLLIGDIEYRDESATTAHSNKKLKPNANNALMSEDNGNSTVLNDANTKARKGAFYYSDTDIDEFNPISVLDAAGTDTRITGMHQLGNRLVVLTTAGGENDGVIVFSGLLSQLHPYNPGTPANPLAVRRQVIKGNTGMAPPSSDTTLVNGKQSVLWSAANMVAFIDKMGEINITDGNTVQKISGNLKPPKRSDEFVWLAAVDKNLLVWQNVYFNDEYAGFDGASRLLMYTLNGTDTSGAAMGAWNEFDVHMKDLANAYPTYAYYNLQSVYGLGTDLYAVYSFLNSAKNILGTRVVRYCFQGPEAEMGKTDNVMRYAQYTTPLLGDIQNGNKILWDRVSVTFHTSTTCKFNGILIKGADIKQAQTTITDTSGNSRKNFADNYVGYRSGGRTFPAGTHTVTVPSGIGSSELFSAQIEFEGNVRLVSVNVYYSGGTVVIGEDAYGLN